MKEVSNVQAIKEFFEANGGRKIGMEEMKALSNNERKELGALAASALGYSVKAELR